MCLMIEPSFCLRDAEEASRRRDGVDLLGMRIRLVLVSTCMFRLANELSRLEHVFLYRVTCAGVRLRRAEILGTTNALSTRGGLDTG